MEDVCCAGRYRLFVIASCRCEFCCGVPQYIRFDVGMGLNGGIVGSKCGLCDQLDWNAEPFGASGVRYGHLG